MPAQQLAIRLSGVQVMRWSLLGQRCRAGRHGLCGLGTGSLLGTLGEGLWHGLPSLWLCRVLVKVMGGGAVGGSESSSLGPVGVAPDVGLGLGSRGVGDVVADGAGGGVLSVSGSDGVGPGRGVGQCPFPTLSLRLCEGSSGWFGLLSSLVGVVVCRVPYVCSALRCI